MKILLISPMPPEIGGVSISTERLKDWLLADGYSVDVFSMSYKNPSLNNRWLRMIRFLFVPFFVIFHSRYDIVHCHVSGIFRMRYIVAFKSFFHGAKLIFTIHRDVSRVFMEGNAAFLKKADCVICVKSGDASVLKQQVESVKAVEIPAFIPPRNIDEADVPSEVLSFAKDSPYPLVISTGAIILGEPFDDLYGLQDTVKLYKQLKNNGISLRLLLVITGNELSQQQSSFLEGLRQSVNDDENVMITALVQMPLVPLFKYAKLFLRPTKTDGDALSVREALAAKCSVLASDVSARPVGCITYHEYKECVLLAEDLIEGKMTSQFGETNFYHQIEALYNRVVS